MKGLFTGLETFGWDDATFSSVASSMKSYGVTDWFVKVADGTTMWYGGQPEILHKLQLIKEQGVNPIPWLYSYGDKFGGLVGECAILNGLHDAGYVAGIDMEIEYNDRPDWANKLVANSRGMLYVITWADPLSQDYQQVIEEVHFITQAFMPQVYTPFLNDVWREQYSACHVNPDSCIPLYARDTLNDAKVPCALWEWGSLTPDMIKKVFAMTQVIITPAMAQQFHDVWNSTEHFMGSVRQGTAIYAIWQQCMGKGKFLGPPISQEYNTVTWENSPSIRQELSCGHIEWYGTFGRAWLGGEEITL